jgi:hypothetical protein
LPHFTQQKWCSNLPRLSYMPSSLRNRTCCQVARLHNHCHADAPPPSTWQS